MLKKLSRLMAVLLSAVFLLMSTAACGNKDPATTSTTTAQESTSVNTGSATIDTATDSSELPDWTGKQQKLTVWQGHGTGGAARVVSPDDVVSPEVKRIFGIELDKENSFDNSGQDLNAKLAVMAASNSFPDIGYNVLSEDLVNSGKIYDLTELLPKYAPHLYKMLKDNAPRNLAKGWLGSGKLYGVPMTFNNDVVGMQTLYPDLDINKYQYIAAPADAQGWNSALYVRDDILKLAYPSAKTQKEIGDIYVKNGKFTKEEVYDIPIKSKQDALDFIYNIAKVIKDNNIKEGGKPVYSTFVSCGQDNWPSMAWLNNLMEGTPNFNYFTYFNPETKKLSLGYEQNWFKDDMLAFNKFIRDGVAPESCLIENNEIFTNKLNNGEYAISYAWLIPDNAKIKAANKPWSYRKVFLDIPQDITKAYSSRIEPGTTSSVSIFKDNVKEEDVPQILQWLDFLSTPVGMKLACWGPKTASLWEEKDGKRVFTNKDAEDCLVYGVANGFDEKYNLTTINVDKDTPQAWPKMPLGVKAGGIYNPKYEYDMTTNERNASNADQFFSSGLFGQLKLTKSAIVTTADIWSFTNEVPSIKSFWDVRGTGFEPLMTKCFAAKSDGEFEKLFGKMTEFAQKNGLNADSLSAAEKLMQDKYPDDWAAYLEGCE